MLDLKSLINYILMIWNKKYNRNSPINYYCFFLKLYLLRLSKKYQHLIISIIQKFYKWSQLIFLLSFKFAINKFIRELYPFLGEFSFFV